MNLRNINFKLTEEEKNTILSEARDIYENPKTRNNRTAEEVLDATKAIVLEFALERLGGKRNNLPFDSTDNNTYCWDVDFYKKRCEIKRWHKSPESNFWSFKLRHVSTMLKNIGVKNGPEHLLVGDYEINDDEVSTKWYFDLPLDSNFSDYVVKSNFNESYYFNHFKHPKTRMHL